MHIAIVDDRPEDRAELMSLLKRYCTENQLSANYQIFSSAEDFLSGFQPGYFQLIFLDIYMSGMNGMNAARQISELDSHCRTIFFTTSHTHAVESYEVRAAYYLTKPLDYSRFCAAMSASCADFLRDNRYLILHCAGLACEIFLRDIIFVDCASERTQLHLTNQVITVDERVSEVFAKLEEDTRFLNCNRNVIVNMDHILKTQENNFLFKNGDCVPIRQRGCGTVKKEFLRYSLRTLRKENGL